MATGWTFYLQQHAQFGSADSNIKFYGRDNKRNGDYNFSAKLRKSDHEATYASLLRQLSDPTALAAGRIVHVKILKIKLNDSRYLGNLLVDMYGKCDALEDAREVFDKMRKPNVYSWTIMVAAYAHNGYLEDAGLLFNKMPRRNLVVWNAMMCAYSQYGYDFEALQLFQQMQLTGMRPDKVTFITILSVCARKGDLTKGKEVHESIKKHSLHSEVIVGNALLNMYIKCGEVEDAWAAFNHMSLRDVASWNAMISGGGVLLEHTLQFLEKMQLDGQTPNEITFISILSLHNHPKALVKGMYLHAIIRGSKFRIDVAVNNALITMYGKCGGMKAAADVFDKMPDRNLISWNAIIVVYAQYRHNQEALMLFQEMQFQGLVPDRFTIASLFSVFANQADVQAQMFENPCGQGSMETSNGDKVYNRLGLLDGIRRLFEDTQEKDVVLWNAMTVMYAQHGYFKEALQLLKQMELENVIPDATVCVTILSTYASQALLAQGKRIHCCLLQNDSRSSIIVSTALVNLYGKFGNLWGAQKVFDEMAKRNVVSWTALISAYGQHGVGNQALKLFNEMQEEGVMPDKVSILTLMSACSHAGLIHEGIYLFISMDDIHGLLPSQEHYHCLIDLLGRAGWLDEAENLIASTQLKPMNTTWMTLLSACNTFVDVEKGNRAAESLFDLDPNNAIPYILLANLYATAKGYATTKA